MRFFALLVLGVLSGSRPASATTYSRCGGDGPQPFHDVTVGIPKAKAISLQGSVSDFLYWENADKIVYRNDRNQIYSKSLQSKREYFFGSSQVGLSPVVDPAESSVLLDRIPYYFGDGYWMSFYVDALTPRHVFWEGKFLFMVDTIAGTAKYSQQIQSHRYRKGLSSSKYLCRYLVPVGEKYIQAEGAEYPIVPFYKVRPTPEGNELSIYEMDVRNCNMTLYGTYKDHFEGKILSVHKFGNLASYAIHTDHPTKSLMWDYGTGCEFYDVGPGALFPTHNRPIVASFSSSAGLEVMNLKTKNRALFQASSSAKSVRAKDAVMGSSRTKLFFAADGETVGRQLYEVDIRELLP